MALEVEQPLAADIAHLLYLHPMEPALAGPEVF
jgi:hypothetical protein